MKRAHRRRRRHRDYDLWTYDVRTSSCCGSAADPPLDLLSQGLHRYEDDPCQPGVDVMNPVRHQEKETKNKLGHIKICCKMA
jgi:hypothetical protein